LILLFLRRTRLDSQRPRRWIAGRKTLSQSLIDLGLAKRLAGIRLAFRVITHSLLEFIIAKRGPITCQDITLTDQ
jgi:hypothetical protein